MAESTYAANIIHLESDDGDVIGGGIEQTLNAPFTANISKSRIAITHNNGFNFTFTPADNAELGAGNFLSAEKTPFNSPKKPGMDVSSSDTSCDDVSGDFYIHDIDFSETSPVLAMDFVQYCDTDSAKLMGSIRINSEIDAPYPDDIGVIDLSTTSAPEGTTIVATTNPSIIQHEPYTVSWQQISGPGVEFLQADEKVTEIKLPEDIQLGGEEVVIQATLLDAEENTIITSESIHVESKSDPQTYLWFSSEDGETIAQGENWYLDLNNSQFNLSDNIQNGVSLMVKNNHYWMAEFAAPNAQALQAGIYANATRFPEQDEDVPGLNISNDERECSESTGEFEVLQIAYNANALPDTFQASFKQRCVTDPEAEPAPLLWGEVAVNAIHLSAPRANAGSNIEVLEGETVNLDGSNSSDREADIISYAWRTDDSSVSIDASDEAEASFTAPTLNNGEESNNITVTLLLTDEEGYQGKDEITVTVLVDNTAPEANNDTVEVAMDTSSDIKPLVNDDDDDGYLQNDTIAIVQQPSSGTAVVYSSGIITYTPTVTTETTDTITYTVKDNDGVISNTATITINIREEVSDGDNSSTSETDGDSTDDEEEEVVYAASFDFFLMISLLVMYIRHRYF
jgi:hypothetical protein